MDQPSEWAFVKRGEDRWDFVRRGAPLLAEGRDYVISMEPMSLEQCCYSLLALIDMGREQAGEPRETGFTTAKGIQVRRETDGSLRLVFANDMTRMEGTEGMVSLRLAPGYVQHLISLFVEFEPEADA